MKLTPNNRNIIFEYYEIPKQLKNKCLRKKTNKLKKYHYDFFKKHPECVAYLYHKNENNIVYGISSIYFDYLNNSEHYIVDVDNIIKKTNKILNIYDNYYFYHRYMIYFNISYYTIFSLWLFCFLGYENYLTKFYQGFNESFFLKTLWINLIIKGYYEYKNYFYTKRIHKFKIFNCGFTDYKNKKK